MQSCLAAIKYYYNKSHCSLGKLLIFNEAIRKPLWKRLGVQHIWPQFLNFSLVLHGALPTSYGLPFSQPLCSYHAGSFLHSSSKFSLPTEKTSSLWELPSLWWFLIQTQAVPGDFLCKYISLWHFGLCVGHVLSLKCDPRCLTSLGKLHICCHIDLHQNCSFFFFKAECLPNSSLILSFLHNWQIRTWKFDWTI